MIGANSYRLYLLTPEITYVFAGELHPLVTATSPALDHDT